MLKLGSVFWGTNEKLEASLVKLGFNCAPSHRFPENKAIFFGPDSVELVKNQTGVFKVELETDDLAFELKNLKSKNIILEKPVAAKNMSSGLPIWAGLEVPKNYTSGISAWISMNSPSQLKSWSEIELPLKHPNTCFAVESLTYSTNQSKEFIKKWATITERPESELKWNEMENTSGHRLNGGDRFFDAVNSTMAPEGVFMITFKVTDIEFAKALCMKAGAQIIACASRDGFIVHKDFCDGIYVRFVRSFWKRYLPEVKENTPYFRREDSFRPLGGTNTSTLSQGFEDNWDY